MPPAGPDSLPDVARSIGLLRSRVDGWRAEGLRVALVPTMGALHPGHLSLVEAAKTRADRTVASIFVNPRQFAAHEDLATYPRDEARDLDLLGKAGCDLAWVPDASVMYPAGFQTTVRVGALAEGLCGASRPHFFEGVATVVCKLLNQCRPDVAIFGEKDYQQLLVIRRMARDLDMAVEIVGAPIVREGDGLAMSSRNVYLSTEERRVAGGLNRILAAIANRLAAGAPVEQAIAEGRDALLKAGFSQVDYLEARGAEDLAPLGPGPIEPGRPARVFAAVFVGKTRLIDNRPALVAAQAS